MQETAGAVTPDYELLERQVRSLLEDERDFIANAANFAAFVYHELPEINWAGFYFPDPATGELVLGPFAGKPACTRLPKGQGVCQQAFSAGRTVVVDDVQAAADHIVCDAASQSEMVVPLVRRGNLAGVFDLDAPVKARFSAADRSGIERLVEAFAQAIG
ncbi:MAG TPA: GAF domain-containing protein [Candidatus Baltobacteraceae bacterium]|nr:GAF domain-containing protein [Candidatus Baltobacteraceae bacterium]